MTAKIRAAALLTAGMLTGSMFGPAVADAARRVIADDLSCTTPCVQDSEIATVDGSKITGQRDADTLGGHDAQSYDRVRWVGDHFILKRIDGQICDNTILGEEALGDLHPFPATPQDRIVVELPASTTGWMSATGHVNHMGDLLLDVCNKGPGAGYAYGVFKFGVID